MEDNTSQLLGNILIIDDSQDNLNILNPLLIDAMYKVQTSGNNHDVSEILGVFHPDLILLNMNVSDNSGTKICNRLKKAPATQNIPILFILDCENVDDKEQIFKLGGVDYISSPFLSGEVLNRVKSQLNLYKLQYLDIPSHKGIEEKLEESESCYQVLTENSQDMIYSMSLPDGHYEYISPASTEMLGYSPNEFYDTPLLLKEMIHPDWKEYFHNEWEKLIEGEMSPVYEYQIIDKSGNIKWLNQRNTLIKSKSGSPVGIEGIVRDVTERKKNEKLLNKSRLIIDSTTDVVLTTDLTGIITFVNKAVIELYGYEPEELIGQSVSILWKDGDLPSLEIIIGDLIKGKVFQNLEMIFLGKQKNEVPVLISLTGIKDETGKVIELLGINRGISMLKDAQEALIASEEKFRSLFENINVGVALHEIVVDKAGNPVDFIYLDVNPMYEQLTTLKKVDVVGRCGLEVLPNLEQKWIDLYGGVALTGKAVSVVDHSDFLDKYWDVKAYSPSINQFAVMLMDITDKMKAEQKILKAKETAERYLDMAGSMFISLDKSGDIILINQKGLEILEYEKNEELIGKNWFETCVPQDINSEIKQIFNKVMIGEMGSVEHYENQVVTKSGNRKIVSWYNSYTRDNEGAIKNLLSSGIDITESRKKDFELRESEERFRELVNTVNSGIAIYKVLNDGQSGSDYIIQDFNKMSLEIEKLTKSEVIGKSLKEIRPNIDDYGLIDKFRKVWKTGEAVFLPSKLYVDKKYSNYYENRIFRLSNGEIVAVYDDVSERENAFSQIKESRERFDLAMKASQDGLFDWNLLTNDIYYSPGWKRMLGYEDNEIVNKLSMWEKFIHPDDLKKSWDMQQDLINKKRGRFEMEFKMKHKDGHWVDILSRAEVLFDMTGKAARMVGTHVDISESKKIVKAMKKSEYKFSKAFDNAPYPSSIINLKTGERLDSNQAFTNSFGYSKSEYLKGKFFMSNKDGNKKESGDILEVVKEQGSVSGQAVSILTKSGKLRQLLINSSRLYPDNEEIFINSYFDITERKRIDEERSKHTALIDQTVNDIMITDTDGIIEYVNPAFEKISGYTLNEVKGSNPSILKSGKHDSTFYKNLWDTIKEHKVWNGTIINKAKDGSIFEEETMIFPIFNEFDILINFAAIKRDTAESRKMEEQLRQAQKMKAIGILAGGIAHDFNNILSSILGYSQLSLERVPKDSKVYSYLEEVITASDRAGDLVKQILLFSRKEEKDIHPVRVQSLIKETLKLLRSSIPRNIDIKQNIDSECGMIMADPTQIHQIIMNLVTNSYYAMKEMDTGEIEITLRSLIIDANSNPQKINVSQGNYLHLSVRDTGSGIPQAKINEIFEPYYTTKEKGEGTGLGLSIVYNIVKSYKGEIVVENPPDQGTIFHLYFPTIEAAKDQAIDVQETPVVLGGSEHIMVVDDDSGIVELNTLMLEDLGYSVTSFISSPAALEHFKENPDSFDLIMTDLTMPVMTGSALVKEILPICPDIPIIICTGFSDILSKEQAKEIGVKDYLMKPYTQKELGLTVRKVFDEVSK